MKKLILFSVFLFSFVYAMGQTEIKGMVFDSKTNEPLIGVSVSVKGTAQGTATDQNGAFQLKVRPTDVLVFKYLGFQEQEVTVGDQSSITVELESSDIMLQEAVITTALGIKRDTRALGYAISSIKGDDLIKAGTTANPLASIYGKAAGVGVQATAAGPMGGMKITIRGAQGLESSSTTRPLFVVDGVPMYDKESSMASRGYDPMNSFDYGSAINDINVEDIESMEILKGAKAAVLYGSEGANGVVLITTKRGNATRGLGVQITYGQEWEVPHTLIDFQNEYGSGEHEYHTSFADAEQTIRRVVSTRSNFGPKFDGQPIMFFDGSTYPYSAFENNFLDIYKTGGSKSVTAALSGGNDKGSMRLSFSNYDYSGITPNQSQIKNSLNFNGQMKVSDFVRFEFIQNLISTKSTNRFPNINHLIAWGTYNRDYDLKAAMNAYKNEAGYMYTQDQFANLDGAGWGWPRAFQYNMPYTFFDMMWNTVENRNIDARINSVTTARAIFQFLPYLTLNLRGSLNYTDTDYTRKNKVKQINESTGTYQGGQFQFSRERNQIQEYEALLTFDKTVMDKLNVNAFIGPAYRKVSYNSVGVGTAGNFKFPDWWSLNNSDSWPSSYDSGVSNYDLAGEALYSVYGQAMLSWGMEYVVEFTARNDWSSTLPKQNRSYFYPGLSFIWNFTETFQDLPVIDYGKLRLSWADVGRHANRYYAVRSYSMNTLPSPYTYVNDISAPSDLFAGDLKPERKREYEIGFDLRMLKNRMQVGFSYFNATWYNQIMGVPLSSTTGANNIRINAGEINNQGVEFDITGTPIKAGPFSWDLSFNITKLWDKIVKLYPGITEKNESRGNLIWKKVEGERMNTLWMQDYLKDENGNRIVTPDGYYQFSNRPEDMINIGSTNTDVFGGLFSNFYLSGRWGMLNLMAGLDYKFGGKILSYSNYYLLANGLTKESLPYRDLEHGGKEWIETLADGTTRTRHDGLVLPGVKADGTENDIRISAFNYYQTFIHDNGTGWQPELIKENSYIKFREVALHYTFPKQFSNKLRLQKLMVGLTARNLFYLYKSIPNIDPEGVLGTGNDSWVENSTFPATRSYGFKVNFSF